MDNVGGALGWWSLEVGRRAAGWAGGGFCGQNSWDLQGWGLTNYVTLFVLTSLSLIVLICEMELMGNLPSRVTGRVK